MTPLRLAIHVSGARAGVLAAEAPARYVFTYDADCPHERFVSLTMPVRLESYVWSELHPVFQMSLPEGELLARLRNRLAKTGTGDPIHILAITGSEMIGRLSAFPEGARPAAAFDTQSFAELMTARDTRPLFSDLVDTYLARGVSGVMPKTLSLSSQKEGDRLTAFDAGALYKTGNEQYPFLARNELHCLRVARRAGIDVPDFELSRDGRVLRVARFDRTPAGPLGFEDFCSLQGLGTSRKYDSTCERVVATAATFAPARHRIEVRREVFRRIVLSHMLRNGDAHLKNWGVVYGSSSDVRLAPIYDLVTTTAYPALRNDVPALLLAGRRTWRLARGTLTRFAQQHCALEPSDVRRIAESLAAAVHEEAQAMREGASRDGDAAATLAAIADQWTTGVDDALAGI